MQEEHLPARNRERPNPRRVAVSGRIFRAQRAAEARHQTQAVTARDHLHASVRGRGIVEREPEGDEWVAVEPPHLAAILMPRKCRALIRWFVHHHRAEDRDVGVGPVHPGAHLDEDGEVEHCSEQSVVLETLDLPIRSGRVGKTLDDFGELVVVAAGIGLEEHRRIRNSPRRQVVSSGAERDRHIVGDQLTERNQALPFEQLPVDCAHPRILVLIE